MNSLIITSAILLWDSTVLLKLLKHSMLYSLLLSLHSHQTNKCLALFNNYFKSAYKFKYENTFFFIRPRIQTRPQSVKWRDSYCWIPTNAHTMSDLVPALHKCSVLSYNISAKIITAFPQLHYGDVKKINSTPNTSIKNN